MSKELEALESLERIGNDYFLGSKDCTVKKIYEKEYNTIKQALTEYEEIKNANPSEALECLDSMYARLPQWDLCRNLDQYNTIKQALRKAQEQEKEIEQFKEIVSLDYLCRVFGYPLGKQIKEYFMSNSLLKQVIERVE